jgi:hypothetical protein
MKRLVAVFAVVAAVVGVAGVGLWAPSVSAHLGGAQGVMPFVDDGVLVAAGTTWGLVTGDDVTGFSQSCEEAIGDVPRAFVRLVDELGPRTLAATGQGVVASVDDGCTWTPVPGTVGRNVTALVASGVTPGTLWAVTASVDGDNAVLVSHDGGAAFETWQVAPVGVLLTSLAVGPVVVVGDAGAGSEQREQQQQLLLVAGTDTVTRRPLLLWGMSSPSSSSSSSSSSSTLLPVSGAALDGAQLVRALAVEGDVAGVAGVAGGEAWFSTLDAIGRGHLHRVLVTAGVMADAVEVGSFDGLVKATGSVAGFRFVIAAGGVVFRALATDLVSDGSDVVDLAVWGRSAAGPLQCLLRLPGDARLWGCGDQSAATWFKATVDGDTWQDELPMQQVSELACPESSPGAQACAYRFADPAADPPSSSSPPPAPAAPSSSCNQAAADPIALMLASVALGWSAGRRHRRRRR